MNFQNFITGVFALMYGEAYIAMLYESYETSLNTEWRSDTKIGSPK